MKRGQLLSQPFFYIFAIVVIGLILLFGFRYAGKLFSASCEAEVLDFNSDVQKQVNQLSALSFGSSYECALVRASGQSDNRCEFVVPSGISGVCFVDTTKAYDPNDIKYEDLRTLITGLGASANRNLFHALSSSSNCNADPANIRKLTSEGVVCVNTGNQNKFILENFGNQVIIKDV